MEQNLPPPPTLEIAGASLRPLAPSDADAIYAYLSDPVVTRLTSHPQVTKPMVEAMLDRITSRWAAGELSKWGLVLPGDDRVIGTCGFNEWSPPHRWAEIAYDLAPAHWGNGLMHQAVAAVIDWTFLHCPIDRIHAYVRFDNERSQKLLERSGFVREGCLRSFRICRGQPHDFYLYALLRADWPQAQTN